MRTLTKNALVGLFAATLLGGFAAPANAAGVSSETATIIQTQSTRSDDGPGQGMGVPAHWKRTHDMKSQLECHVYRTWLVGAVHAKPETSCLGGGKFWFFYYTVPGVPAAV